MNILKHLYLLCIVFLCTVQSYAQPPGQVYTVYRMDFRPLEKIIAEGGFRPWGTDDDVAQHVQEEEIEPQDEQAPDPANMSAFVATSADQRFAYEWGVESSYAQHEPFYIYSIRPTSNFYSVILTFKYLYQQTNNDKYLELIDDYGHQQEYIAAQGGIDITQVHGVQRYEYDISTRTYIKSGDFIPNPSYQQAVTVPNAGPYIQRTQPQNEIITAVSYCALNLSLPRYSFRLVASTPDKYPFLKKVRICHDSLSTIAFLNASFL
ncbi:enterotoxin A family protein [Xenorhabdus griffiniae]|uniref:Enterotoxin A family protein n=1 Tax=Xenorhabdus griffiniae TaxID=351672 RepID=A0ABY9XD36_9GAMM|nr:enterotoxin A family protein [Xenorhabdus griffiniae]MBD1227854.1 hypothetical protein [Xenorhabdus griffiniae]MBE8587800.1 hypothetical protein [Xenorhabdus griffiniae]WMV70827.1 enterotoxin A family protein [Xenorhabdus griffiniae]WNH00503.1 enterotoxin A family protein [Xenorhabdus griffiniae]